MRVSTLRHFEAWNPIYDAVIDGMHWVSNFCKLMNCTLTRDEILLISQRYGSSNRLMSAPFKKELSILDSHMILVARSHLLILIQHGRVTPSG